MNPGYTESAKLLLRQTNMMISLPEICISLREVLADPEHSRKDVADVMRYDPALTARLLRIVNSAYYGLPYRVSSIPQALGILGEHELKNLVLVTSIVKMSSEADTRMDIHQFWKNSILAAVLARNLCSPDLYGTREEYFLAGLLLNVGKLLLYAKEPGLQLEVADLMKSEKISESCAEQQLTGTDHTYVGALLANTWNFSDMLIELIASHHLSTPESDLHNANTIMRLAGYLSDYAADNNGQLPVSGSKELTACPFNYTVLDLDSEKLNEILKASHTEYLEVHEVFCSDLH